MSVNFPEEIIHLDMVEEKLHDALTKLDETVAGYEKEYMEARKYLASYWNEIDSMEVFSNERSLTEIESAGNIFLDRRTKIEKLINAPYFARLDFRYRGEQEAEQIYIGRFTFTADNNDILIYDWRAPVSGMYYEYELGPASYEAPAGSMDGDIERKRQFRINNGELEYALESAVNINDDILQRELSSTSDDKMKTIIATIQKEQNQIIRNDKSEVLIIQGVAGSGKTSIALHRVAYLLYRYKDYLSADNVAIISPNKVFADYISGVLPELGEEPIMEISFEDIASDELSGTIKYERYTDQIDDPAPEWIERSRFKSAPEFITLADKYLIHAANAYFKPRDWKIGEVTITRNYLLGQYQGYRNRPIFQRFEEIADDIGDWLKADKIRDYKIPGRSEIIKKLTEMFQVKSTMELYTDFYRYIGRRELFKAAGKNKLEWPDIFPYLYFKSFIEGIDRLQAIQHLVIDEMQDYTPVQYAVINKMFRCKMTILGDFGQALNPYNLHSLSGFKDIFNHLDVVELNKSYRSTYEIIEFAKQIQKGQRIEPVKRHGEEPEIIRCESCQGELAVMKEKIAEFMNGDRATMGILCKNFRQAKNLYKELKSQYPVHLLDPDSTKFDEGITITTNFMAKGLEFDEVIIPGVTAEAYSSEYDRSLLYVACTRAMHKLTLSFHGSITEFLQDISG